MSNTPGKTPGAPKQPYPMKPTDKDRLRAWAVKQKVRE